MADEPENAEGTEPEAETPEVAGSEGAEDSDAAAEVTAEGAEVAAEDGASAGDSASAEDGEPGPDGGDAAAEEAAGEEATAVAATAQAAGAASPVRPQRPPMHAVAVSFAPVAEAGEKADTSLDFLFDIPVQVTVRLGETRILIRDLLQLGQGSVVELDKLAGEPLEVVVNNKLLARGEVVVVNEKFGIRLTDVVTPAERIHSLK